MRTIARSRSALLDGDESSIYKHLTRLQPCILRFPLGSVMVQIREELRQELQQPHVQFSCQFRIGTRENRFWQRREVRIRIAGESEDDPGCFSPLENAEISGLCDVDEQIAIPLRDRRLGQGEYADQTIFIEVVVRYDVRCNAEPRRIEVPKDDLGRGICLELRRSAALWPVRKRQERIRRRRTVDDHVGEVRDAAVWKKTHDGGSLVSLVRPAGFEPAAFSSGG